MRLPFTKVYRAFPEFDALTDEECQRHIRYLRAARTGLIFSVPLAGALLVLIVFPLCVLLAARQDLLPASLTSREDNYIVMLVPASVLVAGFAWLLLRDLTIWIGVRDEIYRARCPKCKQSLLGLRVDEIGDGLDPAKRFVRCTECGRKHRLMDLGLTPRDLVPFEQRAVPTNVAAPRLKR